MFILGIATLVLQPSQAKPIPLIDWKNLPYQQQVKQMAEGWRAKHNLPGVWCAFIKDGRVVACVATGVKNIETGLPASVTDHLNIGSVSKVITNSLIAQFVSRGVVKYETTVGSVFTELASKYRYAALNEVTLAQLLVHTSGLTKSFKVPPDNLSRGVAWRYLRPQFAYSDNPPATLGAYSYSNEGPVIATAMIERLIANSPIAKEWGATYEDWLGNWPGKSIGLTTPQMLDWSKEPNADEVLPTFLESNGSRSANHSKRPETGIYSVSGSCSLTLTDLCSFSQALLSNRMQLSKQLHYQLFAPFNDVSPHSLGGFWSKQVWRSHSGNTGRGEYANLFIAPERNAAMMFYVNANYRGFIPSAEQDYKTAITKECFSFVSRERF